MTDDLIETAFEHGAKLSFDTDVVENGDKLVYLEYRGEEIHGDVIETFTDMLDAVEWEVRHHEDGEPSYVRFTIERGENSEDGDRSG